MPLAYQSAGPALLPKHRLGRAAKFAFGAAVAGTMTLTACGDDGSGADTGVTDTGVADTGTSDGMATDSAMDAAIDTGNVFPPYGIPPDTGPEPLPDGGDDDGGSDAGSDGGPPPGDSGPAPAYGAPPSE